MFINRKFIACLLAIVMICAVIPTVRAQAFGFGGVQNQIVSIVQKISQLWQSIFIAHPGPNPITAQPTPPANPHKQPVAGVTLVEMTGSLIEAGQYITVPHGKILVLSSKADTQDKKSYSTKGVMMEGTCYEDDVWEPGCVCLECIGCPCNCPTARIAKCSDGQDCGSAGDSDIANLCRAAVSKDYKYCQGIENADIKGQCLNYIVGIAADISVCNKILPINKSYAKICAGRFVASATTLDQCQAIAGYAFADDLSKCYLNAAIASKNTDGCEKMKVQDSDKADCYTKVAVAKNDIGACDFISNDHLKSVCYFNVAVAANNIEGCIKMTGHEPNKDDCYMKVAAAKNDIKICDRFYDDFNNLMIGNISGDIASLNYYDYELEACYGKFINKNGESVCAGGLSDAGKKICLKIADILKKESGNNNSIGACFINDLDRYGCQTAMDKANCDAICQKNGEGNSTDCGPLLLLPSQSCCCQKATCASAGQKIDGIIHRECCKGLIQIPFGSGICQTGVSNGEGEPCNFDNDCNAGLKCKNLDLASSIFRCINLNHQIDGAVCTFDDDCASGYTCLDNKCVNLSRQTEGADCIFDSNCASGYVCELSKCVK